MRIVLLLVFFTSVLRSSEGQNISKDIELGRSYSQYIEKSVGVYDNDTLREFIKRVGDRITDQMEDPLFDFAYSILATPEPNAFSIPGGHLYITTGMFPFLENEDELACIMAHEIIHAQNRHVIKSNRRGIIPGILQIPGGLISIFINEDIGNALASPFRELGRLTHASYNRRQETEADVEGLKLAAKAGYNPDGLASILSRIERYGEWIEGKSEEKDPLATHPMTLDRVEKIEKVKPRLPLVKSNPISSNFITQFEGSLAGRNPETGIITDSLYANVQEGFKIVFPIDWLVDYNANTIVGGNTERKEFIKVDFDKSETHPDTAAMLFQNALNPYVQTSIIGSESIKINELDGHMIAFKESNEEESFYGFLLWVKKDDLLFRFMSMSQEEDQEKMENIVLSLNDIKAEDYEIISYPILDIIETKENETAASIVKRTNNEIDPELLLLINDKEKGGVFTKGESIKIISAAKIEMPSTGK